MIEFLDTGTQAGKLRIAQSALLVQIHCHLCQFIEQLLPLLHQLIDFVLFAAHTQLFLSLPARAAVSRTSWQAQKQLRVRGKQHEIDQLMEQRQQLLDELAKVAMDLYQQGRLSDAQLSRLCASIQELDHDMQNRQQQLVEIKNEVYLANQFAPGATTNYSPPPVSPNAAPPY